MQLTFERAQPEDAAAIAAIRIAAAEQLTLTHGEGPWSWMVSMDAVLRSLRTPYVLVARAGRTPVATLRLQSRKPWALALPDFSPASKALYLVDMAVDPELQRQGVGRECLAEAVRLARAWPARAIRLDAYDAPAGAGAFYQRCGYREVGRARIRGTALRYYECLIEDR